MPAPELAARTREHIDKLLLQEGYGSGTPNAFLNEAEAQARQAGWGFDWRIALEHWWTLARMGAIAMTGGHGTLYSGKPHFIVTQRGRRLLANEAALQDDSRYLAALRRRVTSPDSIAISYLGEAIGAHQAGLYRSSVVMLGCACERLVLVLAEKVAASGVLPYAEKLQRKLAPGAHPSGVSELFDLVLGGLEASAQDGKLPKSLLDAIDRKLNPIFEHSRGLRNRSGHPTGDEVSEEDSEAGLLLFPGFYVFVDALLGGLGP